MVDILPNLFGSTTKKCIQLPLYKAVPSTTAESGFAIGEDKRLYSGIVLEPVPFGDDDFDPDVGYWDAISDAIDNLGCEAPVILPGAGLILGHIYRPTVVNKSLDWESGFVDDWDVELVDVTGTKGHDSEEHF